MFSEHKSKCYTIQPEIDEMNFQINVFQVRANTFVWDFQTASLKLYHFYNPSYVPLVGVS